MSSSKKPSVPTQLKNLKAEYAAQTQQLEKMRTDLENAQRHQKYAEEARGKAQDELNGMHALLDALPDAIPRKPPVGDDNPYPQNHAAATRLSAWLAARSVR